MKLGDEYYILHSEHLFKYKVINFVITNDETYVEYELVDWKAQQDKQTIQRVAYVDQNQIRTQQVIKKINPPQWIHRIEKNKSILDEKFIWRNYG